MTQQVLSGVLMVIGTLVMLMAGIGIVRLPDVLTRASATSKAATLGAGCLLLAVAVFFDDLSITTRALTTIAFIFLTAPVAAHMIGRAAYFIGVPLFRNTIIDELRGRYDLQTHDLAGADATEPHS